MRRIEEEENSRTEDRRREKKREKKGGKKTYLALARWQMREKESRCSRSTGAAAGEVQNREREDSV